MKLSEREIAILGAIELDARAPLTAIAKRLRLRESAVRYTLAKLIEEEVILRRRVYLNPYLLGFTNYAVYFSLEAEQEHRKEALFDHLQRIPSVTWLAELGGDYQYALSYSARSVGDFTLFFDQLVKRYPRSIDRKTVTSRVSLWTFQRKFLLTRAVRAREFFQGGTGTEKLSAADERILRALGKSKFESFRLLAERSGIPVSTFERRLKHLESVGLIQGYYYIVDGTKLGLQEFRVLIEAADQKPDFESRLLGFARKHPAVRKLVRTIGNWDYELEVSFPAGRDVARFVSELKRLFQADVKRTSIAQLFSEVSCSPFVGHGAVSE